MNAKEETECFRKNDKNETVGLQSVTNQKQAKPENINQTRKFYHKTNGNLKLRTSFASE